ncbi:MAG TPA: stage II sporulation protein M [Candidatus Ozemobacteraceae bacterium]|nr:stage II sporulation protein M [Candidatus Ozemobacteraceae bacterium]
MTETTEERRLKAALQPRYKASEAERARWQKLHQLIVQIEARRGLAGLIRVGIETIMGGKQRARWLFGDAPDLAYSLADLSSLYQSAVSDLAKARSQKADPVLIEQLNLLVGRAYAVIYGRPGVQIMDVVRFFLADFPRLVRERRHFLSVAVLVFLCGYLVGFLCFDMDSKLIGLVIPENMRQALQQAIAQGKVGGGINTLQRFNEASRIMFHNMEVGFLAFATGLGFGIGTVYLLILNGMMIGGLAAIYHQAGLAKEFWALILPHGAVELPCIFIAGAGGLMLGYALLNPGRYRRSEWLNHEGYDAVRLVVGTLPLLVAAGLVETYLTPSTLPIPAKYAAAMILGACAAAYLFLPPGWVLQYFSQLQPDIRRQNR